MKWAQLARGSTGVKPLQSTLILHILILNWIKIQISERYLLSHFYWKLPPRLKSILHTAGNFYTQEIGKSILELQYWPLNEISKILRIEFWDTMFCLMKNFVCVFVVLIMFLFFLEYYWCLNIVALFVKNKVLLLRQFVDKD